MSEEQAPPDATTAPRAKQGVPRTSLATAEIYAEGVWAAARLGTAPPLSVARAISGKDDVSASGGRWRAKVTAMRVFHLIEKSEDHMKLSELGLAVINKSDPANQRDGRRRAVLGVEPYAKVLRQSDGTALPDLGVLAGRFEYDYALSPEDATSTAAYFIESVKHAELIDEEGFVRINGGPASVIDDSRVDDPQKPEVPSMTPLAPGGEIEAPQPTPPLTPQPANDAMSAHQGKGAVAIDVTINMSKWPVENILTVLNVFGYSSKNANDE
jgi:hypothetical protein